MKRFLKITCATLALLSILSAFGGCAFNNDASDGEESTTNSALTPDETVTDTSFFEDVFLKIDAEKEAKINASYAKFPRNTSFTALLSRNTAVYTVNGNKVLADAYFCGVGEAQSTPESAIGLLLYSSILYKIANPREKVSISFTTSGFSPNIAVCVLPQSRYYGYVMMLDGGRDHNSNGFVSIGYMLVEAAKMGIDVNVSIASESKSELAEYIGNGLAQKCYEKYTDGERVSEYLTLKTAEWGVDLTALTVSKYMDRFGELHESGTCLTAGTLSGVNTSGVKASSCSAVTVTGHMGVYNATNNFIDLLNEYSDIGFEEFKNELDKRNSAQTELFGLGLGSIIPANELILWLGNWEGDVFKLKFSVEESSICSDELDALASSAELYPEEYRTLIFNQASLAEGLLADTAKKAIEKAFADCKNRENRLSLAINGYKNEKLAALSEGYDVGYLSLKDLGAETNEMLLSYFEDGQRRYSSLFYSPFAEEGEKSVGMMLMLAENEDVGDRFFMSLGHAADQKCVKEDGLSFSCDEIYYQSEKLETLPQTFEALFEVNESGSDKNNYYGMLYSNFDNWSSQFTYEIIKNGNPRVTVWITEFVPDENREKGDHYKMTKLYFKFDKVDVRSYSDVHLAIVHDRAAAAMHCYVNGELKQTIKQSWVMSQAQKDDGVPNLYDFETAYPFIVGGSYSGSNAQHFRGVLKTLAVWADVRSAKEIANDAKLGIDTEDGNLLAAYDFRGDREDKLNDLSSRENDLICERLWQDIDELPPLDDFAYSFALIGDIQVLSERYFNDHFIADKLEPNDPYDDKYYDADADPWNNEIEYIDRIFSWIEDNKDEHKIEYVMTLGDLTQQSYTAEWDYVKNQIYRLNGVVPFSLVAGNHDRRDPSVKEMTEHGYDIWPEAKLKNAYFHKIFNDNIYRSQIDGSMADWDVANTYKAFEVANTKYLLLTLDYGASDEVLAWADGIVSAYPDHKVIISTHAYLYRDGTTVDAYDTYPATRIDGGKNDGDELWDKFISKHENIVLVLSGHDPYDHIVCTKTEGEKGNVVTQLLVDPQGMDAYMPYGTGMIAMLYFSEDGNTVTVRYYSPVYNRYGSVKSQFTFTLE